VSLSIHFLLATLFVSLYFSLTLISARSLSYSTSLSRKGARFLFFFQFYLSHSLSHTHTHTLLLSLSVSLFLSPTPFVHSFYPSLPLSISNSRFVSVIFYPFICKALFLSLSIYFSRTLSLSPLALALSLCHQKNTLVTQ